MTMVGFCLTYIGWIFYIAYASGIWVYGVLEVLTQYQRIVFVMILSLFGVVLYSIGELSNNKMWNCLTKPGKNSKKLKR